MTKNHTALDKERNFFKKTFQMFKNWDIWVLTSGFWCVIIISRTLVRVISKPKETDYETEE